MRLRTSLPFTQETAAAAAGSSASAAAFQSKKMVSSIEELGAAITGLSSDYKALAADKSNKEFAGLIKNNPTN